MPWQWQKPKTLLKSRKFSGFFIFWRNPFAISASLKQRPQPAVAVMKDRDQIIKCASYYRIGKAMREILKANSFGGSGISHHSRSSFFKVSIPPKYIYSVESRIPVLILVGESAEIPIFRIPEARNNARVSYLNSDSIPTFFNST